VRTASRLVRKLWCSIDMSIRPRGFSQRMYAQSSWNDRLVTGFGIHNAELVSKQGPSPSFAPELDWIG